MHEKASEKSTESKIKTGFHARNIEQKQQQKTSKKHAKQTCKYIRQMFHSVISVLVLVFKNSNLSEKRQTVDM